MDPTQQPKLNWLSKTLLALYVLSVGIGGVLALWIVLLLCLSLLGVQAPPLPSFGFKVLIASAVLMVAVKVTARWAHKKGLLNVEL